MLFLAAIAFGAVSSAHQFISGQKAKIKGVIISRDGDMLKLREAADMVAIIAMDDRSKVQVKKGALKFRRQEMDMTALLPGLRIEAEGVGNGQGQLAAEKITFNPDDFKTARSVDTRVAPLEGKQAEMEGKQAQLEGRSACWTS